MKVLQIASSEMPFFQEQVRVLEQHNIDCDIVSYQKGNLKEDVHTKADTLSGRVLNRIYGHNPAYYAYRALTFYPKILRGSLDKDYDIVHLNSGMVAPLGLLQPQRPIVLTLWGDDLISNRLYGYQSDITRFCATQCDSVIVRNQKMYDALPCDAEIIPSGVDMSKFRPIERDEAREEVGWDPDTRHVLFPYPKTQEKKRYPVAKHTVETVGRELDVPVKLQLIDNVPHERMYLYYNASDALFVPSLREGSPNTVKEAMACNVPIVSTDVGDVDTRIGPVSNSYVCTDDDALAEALRSVLERDDRSDGREYVKPVSLKRMGERIIEVYQSVLAGQNSSGALNS